MRRTDVIVVDLDKCVFPGYSQTALGGLIFWRLLTRPVQRSDRRHLPALLWGAFYIAVGKLRRPPNLHLLKTYARVMRGIPKQYFVEEARRLPRFARRGAAAFLESLDALTRVGLITLGTDIVAAEFIRQTPSLTFFRSNRLIFDDDHARLPLVGYGQPLMHGPSAKLRLFDEIRRESDSANPLVIGHDVDDVLMAEAARASGGWSIGIRPRRSLREHFDVWTTGADWSPLLSLWG